MVRLYWHGRGKPNFNAGFANTSKASFSALLVILVAILSVAKDLPG